ncbi:MAG: branched-chain amino acid transaminase [Gammaproteobacteria bacterium]|nr:branched-chain amino acid transaminase [Gammaproteobacteria bacterium]
MADRDGEIWLDGQWLPWREAKIHVLTHTLHYGMGIFEGVRAYEGALGTAIFRLEDHTDRLFHSAHALNMSLPFSKSILNDIQKEVVRRNKLKQAYIRPLCFYGAEGIGLRASNLKVHVMVAAWPWGAYLGAENLTQGVRVKVSSIARHSPQSTLCSKVKATGNYLNSILALQEVTRDGYDEALLLDTEGYVAEGSGENFFLIRRGVLYTPELTSVLEGITRDTIMGLARDNGLIVQERRMARDEVYIADEAFFTGTAAEVTPIREVDGRRIGEGQRGPITQKLQELYFEAVKGHASKYHYWLSRV